ncbi:MAG: type II/IV secretion system protein [Candidatus Magasanikbacteria bacterium]|nr:type II/IV secretion system protein [Candidatus Magasanikbacteria bacterium]
MNQSPKIATEDVAGRFGKKMQDIEIKEKEQEAEKKAAGFGLPYINLFRFPITPDAISLIPEEEARRLQTVCFLYTGPELRVGAVNPQDGAVLDLSHALEERHHSHGEIYLISEHSLEEALKFYAALPRAKPRSKDVAVTEEDLSRLSSVVNSFKELKERLTKETSVSEIVIILLAAALKFDSSDIHIEAEEEKIVVRFRLDGLLQDIGEIPKNLWPRIISRVKLLSGLKINITDKPQDGRFTIALAKQKIDVRVSTLPTVFGESAVMRILKPMAALTFEQLGLEGAVLETLKRQVKKPTGMVIATGPTGSGKTTTLYAVLQVLNQPGVKIITLEDPVEYKLAGINQSQIDASRDYTFAKGLQSLLRQDPDIVMVGEIRDLETAEVAIQAALTGHFMLSTIHTNSAAGSVPRFLAMGVKPFLLAPALNAVMGQRLARRLCEKCKREIQLEEETLVRVKGILSQIAPSFLAKKAINLNKLKFFNGSGCEACHNLGYKGRIGIYELLEMNKEIEQLILKSEFSVSLIEEAAIRNGMLTMAQDGLLKALEGITSVEEVFRVAQ